MTGLRVFLKRLLGRGRTSAQLDEEIAEHLAQLAAEYEHRGLAPEEALAAARRHFGPITQLHEAYREQRRLPFLDALCQDLGFALRQLRRNPGFAAAAVITLALGIGANSAIYQVLDAVVFRQLPVRQPASLVQVQMLDDGRPVHVSYPFYRQLAARQEVMDGLVAVSDFPLRQAVLRGRGSLRAVKGSLVSGNYFAVLGVGARAGRVFTAEDDQASAPPVMVLSDAFWSREFARDPAAIGQVLEINGAKGTIIGVTPPEFFGETMGSVPDVWLPVAFQPQFTPAGWLNGPSHSWLTLLGRLRAGVSMRQAQASLAPLYANLAELTVQRMGHDYRAKVVPASRGIAALEERFGEPLWVLFGITGMVLLLAASNLANLMLGRAAARTQEMGVRLALGAGRWRIARQLLTESLLLAALGTAAALVLARSGAQALVAWASTDSGWGLPLGFAWRHVAFTAAVAVGATCLFALAPAWSAAGTDLQSALQAGSRGSSGGRFRNRLGKGLIAAQLAVSLTLLSAAALLTHSLWNLRQQDFGYDADRVVMADLPLEFTKSMIAQHTALRGPLYQRIGAIPGVRSVAVSAFGVLDSTVFTCHLSTAERAAHKGEVARQIHVSKGYFETMGTRILAGRGITDEDRADLPHVAVLGETAARALFGGGNAIGRVISTGRYFETKGALEVVGVAADVRFADPREPYGFVVYVPMEQSPAPVTAVVARAAGDTGQLAADVRAAIHGVDSGLMVGSVRTIGARLEAQMRNAKLLTVLSACFGVLALAVTAVGVYGVAAYAVERRAQEIGIRLALGAAGGAVSRMMMAEVALVAAAGIVAGAAGAVAATRVLRGLLFGAAGSGVPLFLAAGALLLGIAALAAYLPARRAARLDPMVALRRE